MIIIIDEINQVIEVIEMMEILDEVLEGDEVVVEFLYLLIIVLIEIIH